MQSASIAICSMPFAPICSAGWERIGDAGRVYDAALARGQNTAEREFLQRRRAQLEPL